ncbi:MAG: hypothetical protein MJ252_08360 [archaeon]|nr:hypothetical protein [archaeon]
MAFINSNLSLDNYNSRNRFQNNDFLFFSRGLNSENSEPFKFFPSKNGYSNEFNLSLSDFNLEGKKDNYIYDQSEPKKDESFINLTEKLTNQTDFTYGCFKIERK